MSFVDQQLSGCFQSKTVKFTPTHPGFATCKAHNHYGSHFEIGLVLPSIIQNTFQTNVFKDFEIVTAGDQVKLECSADIYNYSEISWNKKEELINLSIIEVNSNMSTIKSTICFNNITKTDEGFYQCVVISRKSHESEVLNVTLKVHEAKAPSVISNTNQSLLSKSLGDSLTLDCFASGFPLPSMKWLKNTEPFHNESDEKNSKRIIFSNNYSSIDFSVLKPEDSGTYRCVAENRIGSAFKEFKLEIPVQGNLR